MDRSPKIGPASFPTGAQPLPCKRASRLIVAALTMVCANALAQTASQPVAPEPAKEAEAELPSSSEQGQVHMEDSFQPMTKAERVRAQRKKAFEDTEADVQIRSYLLERDKFDGSEIGAMALGGYAGFKTGNFRDYFAVGATVYTSQKLWGPLDKDGTLLLKPGQESYTALGETYGQFRVAGDVFLNLGRKAMDTPYINKQDSRMSPSTFQGATLIGEVTSKGSGDVWRFGLGYVDEMKQRNSTEFVSMSEAAGAPVGVDRGVSVGGLNYRHGDFSIGFVDYYSNDIINIFYSEASYTAPTFGRHKFKLAAQYTKQQATGDNLLTGSEFSTSQLGAKADLGVGNALFTTAWTGNGSGADLASPWGSIPSYNSVQVEDFHPAGVESWMLRGAYDFKSVPGLSAYALWVKGSQPTDPTQSARDEYDFNLRWAASEGAFKGLSLCLRYAVVTQEVGGPDLRDFRFIINYDPPSL